MLRLGLASFATHVARRGSSRQWGLGRGCPGLQRYATGVAEAASPPENRSGSSSNGRLARRVGALAFCGIMGWVAASAAEDLFIYDQCSSKAVERAAQDPRLKEVLGEGIQRGQWHWYEASLAVAHEGTSASCSFPVYGSQGTAKLRLKAVRLHGLNDSVVHNIFGGGRWEVLMLEALIPESNDEKSPRLQRINLMQTSDEPRTGDGTKGDASACSGPSTAFTSGRHG